MGEGKEELYEEPEKTQMLANQHIKVCPIGDCSMAIEEFHHFLID